MIANAKIAIGGGINEPLDALLPILYGLLTNPDLEKRSEKAENKLHQLGIRLCRFRCAGRRHHLSEVAVISPRHPHLLNAQMVTMSAW